MNSLSISIGVDMFNRQGFIFLSLCLMAIATLVHADQKVLLKNGLSKVTQLVTNKLSPEELKMRQVKEWLTNKSCSDELSPAGLPKDFNNLGELLSYAKNIHDETEAKIKGLYININMDNGSLKHGVPEIKNSLAKPLGLSEYYSYIPSLSGVLIGLILGSLYTDYEKLRKTGALLSIFSFGFFTNGLFAENNRSTLKKLLNEYDTAGKKISAIEGLLKNGTKS
jgi:hypothetical protein